MGFYLLVRTWDIYMTQCGKAANTPDMRLHINMPAIQPQAVTLTQRDPTFKALWSGHVASQPELPLSSQTQSPFAKRTVHTRSVHLPHPWPADPPHRASRAFPYLEFIDRQNKEWNKWQRYGYAGLGRLKVVYCIYKCEATVRLCSAMYILSMLLIFDIAIEI